MVIESKIPKEAEIPPTDFVIVGGTGDLALRKIFPALFHRFLDGQIPESCALIAAARNAIPKTEFLAQLRPFCDEVITRTMKQTGMCSQTVFKLLPLMCGPERVPQILKRLVWNESRSTRILLRYLPRTICGCVSDP